MLKLREAEERQQSSYLVHVDPIHFFTQAGHPLGFLLSLGLFIPKPHAKSDS